MPSSDLQSLYRANALSTPEAMLAAALRKGVWDLAVSVCQAAGDQLPPAKTVSLLARQLAMPESLPQGPSGLFAAGTTDDANTQQAWPPFMDAWLLALLRTGVDPDLPVSGRGVEASDQWSGSVRAFAVLLDAPQSLAELARRESVQAVWSEDLVEWKGEALPLLHLACATGRWAAAKFLVNRGFPTHRPGPKGALPWEHVRGDTEVCTTVLDELGLWPRNDQELNAGWKRRGVATTRHEGSRDRLWRLTMIERMGQGSDVQLAVAIEHLLRITEARMGADWVDQKDAPDIVGLWNSLSPEDRERPVDLRQGPMRGRWSLAGALCWAAAWAGQRALPVKAVHGTRPELWDALPLDLLGQVASHISAEELDRPIVQRKQPTGEVLTLTARGLWGVAQVRAEEAQVTTEGRYALAPVTPTPAWTDALLQAWAMLAAQVKRTASSEMVAFKQRLLTLLVKTDDSLSQATSWKACLAKALDASTRMRRLVQAEKGEATWSYAMWLLDHTPEAPLPTEVVAGLPCPLEGLAILENKSVKSAFASGWDRRAEAGAESLLARWEAWGWSLTLDQVTAAGEALDRMRMGTGSPLIAAFRERQAIARVPPPPVRHPRVRS